MKDLWQDRLAGKDEDLKIEEINKENIKENIKEQLNNSLHGEDNIIPEKVNHNDTNSFKQNNFNMKKNNFEKKKFFNVFF